MDIVTTLLRKWILPWFVALTSSLRSNSKALDSLLLWWNGESINDDNRSGDCPECAGKNGMLTVMGVGSSRPVAASVTPDEHKIPLQYDTEDCVARDDTRVLHSSIYQVLESSELLESILHALPVRDLLLYQRVCRTWYHVIHTSLQLQQDLFLIPRPSCRLSSVSRDGNVDGSLPGHGEEHWELNPLLVEVFRPFFAKRNLENYYRSNRRRSEMRHAGHLVNLAWVSSSEKYDAYRRCSASWRRMLVVQPAVYNLEITKRAGGQTGRSDLLRTIVPQPTGLCMGFLADAVIHHALGSSRGFAEWIVRWDMFKSAQRYAPRVRLGFQSSVSCIWRSLPPQWVPLRRLCHTPRAFEWEVLDPLDFDDEDDIYIDLHDVEDVSCQRLVRPAFHDLQETFLYGFDETSPVFATE